MVTEVFNAKPKLSTLHVSCAKWLLECPPFASSLCSQSDVNYNLARWQVEPKAKAPVQVPPWLSSTRRLRQASWTEYIVDMSACIYVSIYIYIYGTPPKTHLFMSFKYTFYEFQIYWWDKWGLPFALHTYIYPHIYIYIDHIWAASWGRSRHKTKKTKTKKPKLWGECLVLTQKIVFFGVPWVFFVFFFLGFWKSKNKKHWCFFHKCTIN